MPMTPLERRGRSALHITGRQTTHRSVCSMTPATHTFISCPLAHKGQGWGSGLVHPQPPSLVLLMPWTFTLSLPPFSWATSLTSCTCPSAVPRDRLKTGSFWKGKDPLFYENFISICCFQRFPWLITPSMLSALPLLHLHQLLLGRCHKAPSPAEEEQQPAPATRPRLLSCYYTKTAAATVGAQERQPGAWGRQPRLVGSVPGSAGF